MDANRVVRLGVAGGVATVTLDAPATRNALSSAMLEQLAAALRLVREDDTVRVVVLTGGGTVFCAGADLKESRARAAGLSAGQPVTRPATSSLHRPYALQAGTERQGGFAFHADVCCVSARRPSAQAHARQRVLRA